MRRCDFRTVSVIATVVVVPFVPLILGPLFCYCCTYCLSCAKCLVLFLYISPTHCGVSVLINFIYSAQKSVCVMVGGCLQAASLDCVLTKYRVLLLRHILSKVEV